MADLSQFRVGIEQARNESFVSHQDPRLAFLNELTSLGWIIPQGIIEDVLQRFDLPHDKKGAKTGWYVFYTSPDYKDPAKYMATGIYGSWDGNPFDKRQ